ncbi:zinc ribbon domain-containing protein [Cellvibrio sp. KY-GH-1]|uniref:zinc ribbon domain-containing protein n=1 Tax=Cellvibrio sp. KY-GH-1 TaxID=2303332 RepID=UPI001243E042|nr:zinc ribbon domain-containing protein [Cellvibrio sp. KY-GH-1]QEY15490.1 zinc ribbon domain-containing protein [Cellvibrio sp. KY-GH-1]
MALVKCKECGTQISSSAKSCPHCGKELLRNKEFGCGSMIVLIIFISIIYSQCTEKPKAPDKPKTPEELRRETVEKAFSPWDGSHRQLEAYVKKNLKDPDSYEHIETRYSDKGDTVTISMKYRAKNSFGGYAVENIIATAKLDGTLITVNSTK